MVRARYRSYYVILHQMDRLKKILFYSGLGIIIIVETLDLSGVLDITGKKIDILLGISLLVASFIVELYSRIERIEAKVKLLENRKYINIKENVADEMNLVVGGLISDLSDNLKAMIVENRFLLQDVRRFSTCYNLTLNKFPNSIFYATSDLHGSKFWAEDTVNVVKRFTSTGGKIKRIFIVEDTEQSLDEAEIKILAQQQEAGVEIYAINLKDITSYKNYIVESEAIIGWDVLKNQTGEIYSAELNVRNEKTRGCVDNFKELINHPALRAYDKENSCFTPL